MKLVAGTRTFRGDVWFKRDKPADKDLEMHSNGVLAEGGDDFHVVITIQRGAPTPVEVRGKGLEAEVIVGRRRITSDGEKIRLDR